MGKRVAFAAVLSFATGAAIWYFIGFATDTLANPQGPPLPYLLLNYLLMIVVAPSLFGFFVPEHAWQWGIYVVLGQLIFGIATSPGDLNLLPLGILIYLVFAIPAVLTGIAGAYVSNRLVRKSNS